IPLTPNGKVDRKALPAAQVKKQKKYRPPANEIQRTLTRIWAEILALPEKKISTEAGFFEMGGHSLKATILVTRIRKELQVEVPLVQLFRTPTVKGLEHYIATLEATPGRTHSLDENLVLLRKGNTAGSEATKLFFIHDGSGDVDGYVEFCRHLDNEFDCWGISAERQEGYAPQNLTIEKLAAKYITSMKKIQTIGPYYICAWSMGGTIAFEIAKQLEKSNQKIACLALFDSPAPQSTRGNNMIQHEFTRQSELKWLDNYLPPGIIKKETEQETGIPGLPGIEQLWCQVMDHLQKGTTAGHFHPEDVKKLLPQGMAQVIPNYDHLGMQESIYYLNKIRSLNNARANYRLPGQINTRAHLFAANQSEAATQNWTGHFYKTPMIHEVEGDHFSIFRLPAVIPFAAYFNRVLSEIVSNVLSEGL
ncbi:MAG: hypothetical protein GY757_42470, partial [bacterium]|nr:hypothetical protein [bacterium]